MPYSPMHLAILKTTPFFQISLKSLWVSLQGNGLGSYEIVVGVAASRVEDISNVSSSISASLSRRFESFAVTQTDIDVAFNSVTFAVEDATIDRILYCDSVEDLRSSKPHILAVQKGASIDLSTSESMLVAGKTRSGKTTGIIGLLLQALLAEPDDHGSRVTIIDPKRAELSQFPHVVTLDADGGGRAVELRPEPWTR